MIDQLLVRSHGLPLIRALALAVLAAPALGASADPQAGAGRGAPAVVFFRWPEAAVRDAWKLEYPSGNADGAVEYFARHLDDFDEFGRLAYPGDLSALFLTEITMRANTFGRYARSAPLVAAEPSIGLTGMHEVWSLRAYRAITEGLNLPGQRRPTAGVGPGAGPPEAASPNTTRSPTYASARSWFVLTVSYCERWRLDSADALLAAAEHAFPEHPEIVLLSGAMAEARNSPGRAERKLRGALTADPALVEARVRLGRVLMRTGRTAEARTQLDAALKAARASQHAFAEHFALRLLGDLDRAAGRISSARRLAAEAAAVRPTGPGAPDPLFKDLDDWALYRAAQFYQQPRRIAALRNAAR